MQAPRKVPPFLARRITSGFRLHQSEVLYRGIYLICEMPRRKKKKLTERLSAWKEEQKKEKQPSQQDDKQAEIESVQEVESGVQEPAEMLMEVEETIPLKNALEIKT
ncbi:uncharacterized protein LOC144918258 isoform X1 [Branchiostoma floridae x Branchiostoma belcheri]